MDVIYKIILVNLFGAHPHQSEFKGIWAVKYFQGLENQQEMKSSNNYLLKVTQLKRGRNDFSSLIASKTKAEITVDQPGQNTDLHENQLNYCYCCSESGHIPTGRLT